MTADPILTLAWLALAHLVTDFVIQSNRVATEKFGFGRRAWQALATHSLGAAVCLLPFVVAFGLPGLELLVVVSVAHAAIDRAKIIWTMRVEAAAVEEARALHEGPVPAASLGVAWTPLPALLFVLDQLAHVVVMLVAWFAFLASAPLTDGMVSAARDVLGSADPATAHRVILTTVVLLNLGIVNVRAASLFVATLVRPREFALGEDDAAPDGGVPADGGPVSGVQATTPAAIGSAPAVASSPATGAAPGWVPASTTASQARPAALVRPRATVASPARVGATIGVLERLLIVAFVLTNATAAVGFVVAAKTIARFKQLDDRQFAEYYLLGTLASVSVALASALVAAAALASVGTP